jgi:2'-hydroxyisoflavone reductase
MNTTRRDFLKLSAAVSGAASLGLAPEPTPAPERRRGLQVLILGGTGFIGPHIVRSLQERGHRVTLFNRGRTNTHLFPDVEKLVGDRVDNLTALEGRAWHAVIDNARQSPRWVRDSAQLLKGNVGCYLFTSTRSVYSDVSQVGMTEDGPLAAVEASWVDDEDRRLSYGQAKVLSEMELRKAFPEDYIIVRPGLIIGPGDDTDRFTYWPARVHRGGEVLAPGDPENPVMFIDARDLADFYVTLIENGTRGVFNGLGPSSPLSFAEMLYGCRAVTNSPVSFTWVDTDFLLERRVRPYSHMPCWRPAEGRSAGFQRFDLSRPLAAGITYRPLAVTAKDTLDFHLSRNLERQQNLRAGITAERETELLEAWHSR